jgi:hypothetical protein
MGPSHSTIKNHTEKRICVITFTYTDLLYFTYNTLYTLEPGVTRLVESQPDAIGLKIGVIYNVSKESKEFKYQRFVCKMDSVLNISEIDYDTGEISWFGDDITGYTTGKMKESNITALTMAYEAVLNLPLTVGQKNGKFEKELIKRVATEYMASKSNNNNDNDGGQSSSKHSKTKSTDIIESDVPSSKMNPLDTRSAADKWERELERMKLAAAEQEKQLNESKVILNERLARVAQEEAFAAEIDAKRVEELRQEELRQKQLMKELAEEENDKKNKKLKKRKNRNCSLS